MDESSFSEDIRSRVAPKVVKITYDILAFVIILSIFCITFLHLYCVWCIQQTPVALRSFEMTRLSGWVFSVSSNCVFCFPLLLIPCLSIWSHSNTLTMSSAKLKTGHLLIPNFSSTPHSLHNPLTHSHHRRCGSRRDVPIPCVKSGCLTRLQQLLSTKSSTLPPRLECHCSL